MTTVSLRTYAVVLLAGCGLAHATALCGCCRTDSADRPARAAPASAPAEAARRLAIIVGDPGGGGDGGPEAWSVLKHEYLASELAAVWVETKGGRYSPGYCVPGDGPGPMTLYVVRDIVADAEALPNSGPISSASFASADEVKGDRVVEVSAPVRYLRRADGRVEPGFFEPAHGVFFRWRGQTRRADQVDFMPGTDPVPLEVHPERAPEVIDIDPPQDMDEREPLGGMGDE